MKKIPIRQCVVTKERLPKKELIRIVRTPENNVIIDESGRANGRGAYLKKDIAVINAPATRKVLSRNLEVEITDEIIHELIAKVHE